MAGARGSARRELVTRLFGSGNRRRGRRVSWREIRTALVLVLPVAVGATLGPRIRGAISRHPYFALSEVIVRDAGHVPPDEVRTAAGIRPGMSVWDVDVAAAESRLRSHAWIRSARVRRELPHRVVIHVREERATAIVETEKGEEYYVSARGRIFARVGASDARDLAYVTGLAASDLASADAVGPRALRRALALVRHSGGLVVSEIHVDRARGLTLMPVRPAIPIELGWSGFEQKLGRLKRVLALWTGREPEIAAVSLLFDDEVIVRTRAATKRRAT